MSRYPRKSEIAKKTLRKIENDELSTSPCLTSDKMNHQDNGRYYPPRDLDEAPRYCDSDLEDNNCNLSFWGSKSNSVKSQPTITDDDPDPGGVYNEYILSSKKRNACMAAFDPLDYNTAIGNNFAMHLKFIQESQDAILADIRLDMEQLQTDNLTLRQHNSRLIAERNHWEKLYHDMRKNVQIMKEHLHEIQDSTGRPRKPSLCSVNALIPGILDPQNNTRDPLSFSSVSLISDQIETRTRGRKRSKPRICSSSQASLTKSTATETSPQGKKGSRKGQSRKASKSARSSLDPLVQPISEEQLEVRKHKQKGCFHFFRRKKSKKLK